MDERIPRVLALVGTGDSSNIVLRAIDGACDLVAVVEEDRVSKKRLIRARLRRLGPWKVADQLIFQVAISPTLARLSKTRADAIRERAAMNAEPLTDDRVRRVENINETDIATLLAEFQPDVVVINGTRILRSSLLDAISVPVLNIHAGITPAYRGVHGGYWALREGHRELCGVTVHLVDSGIDTGGVIAQTSIEPTDADNFATYPLLQLEAGIPMLLDAVRDAANDRLKEVESLSTESSLYYHPGASVWLSGLISGVK